MKYGSLDHPAITELKDRLGVPKYMAIGILEACWQQIDQFGKRYETVTWPDSWVGYAIGDMDMGKRAVSAMFEVGFLVRVDGGWECGRVFRAVGGEGTRKGHDLRSRLLQELGEIPTAVRREVLAVGKCEICPATTDLTVDHIRPITRGGDHSRTNLRCLCRSCNSRKKDHYGEALV